MNPIARALIGFGTVGGAIGGGFVLNNYLSSENIKSKLEASGFELLGQEASNSATWNEILENYKIVVAKGDTYKFDDFLGTNPANDGTPKAVDVLKKKCEETLAKKLNEDKENQLYEKAKKWCTKPRTISESLGEGFTSLKTNVDDANEEKEAWTKKVNDHKASQKDDERIAELDLSTTKDNSQIDADIKKIKEKCKTISGIKNHADGFEDSLKKFETWCAIKNESKG